ncbi:hypothetical protein CDAR_582591 [Caerostris darwini]|uniref:Uncharacterized protein n=1 Tax=Caerostris darwini TaxID=1538125 RepID=A0AAV4PK50_9ARAC|nr:hypothetical protein CDAR_582591 [Caerostris darwini]
MARPDGEVTDHYPFDLFTANTPDSGVVMKFWGRFYLCFDRRRKILCVALGATYRGRRKEIKNWPDTYIFDLFCSQSRGGHFLEALKEIHAPGRVIKTSFIGLGVKPIYRIPSKSLMARPDGEVTDHYPFDLFTANTPDSGAVMKFWGRFYLCFDRRSEILDVALGTTYRGYRKEIKNWPDTYIFDDFCCGSRY